MDGVAQLETLLAAVLVAMAVAAPAQAQSGPITTVAKEGTGTATASGEGYSATLQNTFTPSRIKPGDGFTYDSVMTIDEPEWGGYPTTETTETADWAFSRVPRGGVLWNSSSGSWRLSGTHTIRRASPPGQIINTLKHVVSGAKTADMPPGCYQSTNWEVGIAFPGRESTGGHMATLVVYDAEEERWPTCEACPTGTTGPDDDGDGFADTCDDLECKAYTSGINGCDLLPGDILVDRGSPTNPITQFNSNLGDTYWTHAAIVLGYMNLDYDDTDPTPSDCSDVEPRFEGDEDPECELVVAEATPGVTFPVRILKLADTVWGDEQADNSDWNVVRLDGLSSSLRRQAAQKLKTHLLFGLGAIEPNAHFKNDGGQDVVQWGAQDGDYLLNTAAKGPNFFYCSSLVWWAYDQVGIDLDGDFFSAWPWEVVEQTFVTPDELVSHALYEPRYLRAAPQGWVHAVYSPAHIMVIDNAGRRTGKDGAGALHEEIPNAIWRDNGESESVSLHGSFEHKIRLSGYDTGKYTFVSSNPAGLYNTPIMSAGFTRPGQIEEIYSVGLQLAAARPAAADDEATVSPPEATIDVLANDFVPGEASVYMEEDGAPTHGTATVVDNKVRYVPAQGYVGPDSFTYWACNPACGPATATVTLDVLPGSSGGGTTDPGGGGGTGGTGSTGGSGATGGSGGGGTSTGPAAPDSGGTAPGGGAPRATLTVAKRQRLKKALRLRVRCPGACELVAGGRLGRATVRGVRKSLGAAGEVPMRLRLRGKARRPGMFRLVVTVRHADGSDQRLRAKIRLRR